VAEQLPASGPTTIDVPLYPRSARLLHDAVAALADRIEAENAIGTQPNYVLTDICNFRNHLAAHLQRVAIGE